MRECVGGGFVYLCGLEDVFDITNDTFGAFNQLFDSMEVA